MKRCTMTLIVSFIIMLPACTLPQSHIDVVSLETDLPVIPDGVVSRAISWENKTGEPGAGGKEGGGRKGSSFIRDFPNATTVTLMDVSGCGVIRHIWFAIDNRKPEALRNVIIRMYWDNSPVPSVEVPFGDFFGTAHGRDVPMVSAYTSVVLGRAYNCYFAMPFATHAKITLQNDLPDNKGFSPVFFQIDYELRDRLPTNTGRFHAQFRRQNPTVLKQDYVLLDNVEGPGYYLGCVLGVRAIAPAWWGEGEMKFYLDGDTTYPTICGTGTEDYFCLAWEMSEFQTPYSGCTVLLRNDLFPHDLASMYRFHVKDPVYFRKSLKVTMQQIGYGNGLEERSDDLCSVAYWYQLKPVQQMPPLPDRAVRIANIIEPPPQKKG